MSEFFNRLHGVELFFLVCAVVGGVFVLIRLVVMMIGLDHGVDGDLGSGGHDFDGHHADSDVGFKLLQLSRHGRLFRYGWIRSRIKKRKSPAELESLCAGAVRRLPAPRWQRLGSVCHR